MQGPKLSRGHQLLQAATMQGSSPGCHPGSTSSPPGGSAPPIRMHTPPGSYTSPVLRLSESPSREDDNSNSPLFSAAVGVIRSPSRMRCSHSAGPPVSTSPHRVDRSGRAPLPCAPHLKPHPPVSPGACAPHGGPPAAQRSPMRASSAGLMQQGMHGRHHPAPSPQLGMHGYSNGPRKWRHGSAPGAYPSTCCHHACLTTLAACCRVIWALERIWLAAETACMWPQREA